MNKKSFNAKWAGKMHKRDEKRYMGLQPLVTERPPPRKECDNIKMNDSLRESKRLQKEQIKKEMERARAAADAEWNEKFGIKENA